MKKKKKVSNRCATPYCKNNHVKRGKFCHTCYSRKKRAKNPMRYAYDTLKYNETRRGKPFTITFAYFKKFCYRTNYMQGKGRTKESYSVDCKINELGCVPGNIRCITVSENASKGTKQLEYDWRTRTAKVVTNKKQVYADGPF